MSDGDTVTRDWYDEGLRFSCTQCGNCCTGPTGYVWYTPAEGQAIADHLGLSLESFEQRYTRKLRRGRSLNETRSQYGYDCVFLRRDEQGKALCSIYPVRPSQCKTWPFWPENLATPDNYLMLAKGCPGVRRGLEGEGTFYPVEQIRIRRDQTRE